MKWTSYLPSSPEILSSIEWWAWIIVACLAISGVLISLFARGVGQYKSRILQTQLTGTLTETKDKVLDIEKKQTPRRLSNEQKEIIIQKLKMVKGAKININSIFGDAESMDYGEDFMSALKLAGWQVEFLHVYSTTPVELILIINDKNNPPPGSIEMGSLFMELGIHFKSFQDANAPPNIIIMNIGRHP